MRDVEILEQLYDNVSGYVEPRIMEVDRVVNDRGIPIDTKRVATLEELFEKHSKRAGEEFSELTGSINPGSHKQVQKYLESMGFALVNKNTGKKSIGTHVCREFFAKPEDFYTGDVEGDEEAQRTQAAAAEVRHALELRREIVRAGGGKLKAARAVTDSDGRGREQMAYWKAHTGRWAGRALQV